jgi:rhodanese-related sulfurtransferase
MAKRKPKMQQNRLLISGIGILLIALVGISLAAQPSSLLPAEIPVDQAYHKYKEGTFVVVICRSGNRSQVGRDILMQAGFESVTSAAGGLKAWSAAEYPIEGTRP